jgi:hypothetical protein
MFKSKKPNKTALAAASALHEALRLSQRLLAENQRLIAENASLRQDLLASLNRQLELREQLDAVDPGFLSAVGVKIG